MSWRSFSQQVSRYWITARRRIRSRDLALFSVSNDFGGRIRGNCASPLRHSRMAGLRARDNFARARGNHCARKVLTFTAPLIPAQRAATMPPMSSKSVANNLRSLRLQRGLTQKELAKICALSESTISAAESGSRNTRFPTLLQICRGLGVPPEDLAAEAQGGA